VDPRKKTKKMRRKQRYNQKLAELEDRIEFITANLGTKKTFQQNRLHSKGIYKEYQELVESITDLAAMTAKDQNKIVEDDYSNLDKLATTLHLNTEHTIQLKKANGLRNILVHEYNGII